MWFRRIKRKLRNLGSAWDEAKSTWSVYPEKPTWWRIKRVIYINPITSLILDPYYTVRGFFSRVKRVLEFVPVIWKTHDWDHAYLTTIWAYTVERSMVACIDKGHHVVRKNDRKNYKTVIALLKRMSEDDYDMPHYDYHGRRWKRNIDDFYFEVADVDKKGKPLTYRQREPHFDKLNDRDKELYHKELKAVFDHGNYMYKQDVDLLCKLLKKHLRSWWD